MLVGSVMLLSLFLGNVEAIALASNFGIVFSYMLTGVEVMRVRRRGLRGKFRSPAYPWLQVAQRFSQISSSSLWGERHSL